MAPTSHCLAFLACAYLFIVMLFAGVYVVLAKVRRRKKRVGGWMGRVSHTHIHTIEEAEGGRVGGVTENLTHAHTHQHL